MSVLRNLLVPLVLMMPLLGAGPVLGQGRGGPGGGPSHGVAGFGGGGPGQGGEGPLSAFPDISRGLSAPDAARRAVQRHEALPLDQILIALRKRSAGQVIDAALVRDPAGLYYRLTVLEASGEVRQMSFNAATGDFLKAR